MGDQLTGRKLKYDAVPGHLGLQIQGAASPDESGAACQNVPETTGPAVPFIVYSPGPGGLYGASELPGR